MKNVAQKVRLFLQIPPENAKRVVGTLWAIGVLSRKQYERNMRWIDGEALSIEKRKREKLEKQLAEVREFYKKKVKKEA